MNPNTSDNSNDIEDVVNDTSLFATQVYVFAIFIILISIILIVYNYSSFNFYDEKHNINFKISDYSSVEIRGHLKDNSFYNITVGYVSTETDPLSIANIEQCVKMMVSFTFRDLDLFSILTIDGDYDQREQLMLDVNSACDVILTVMDIQVLVPAKNMLLVKQ